MNSEIHGADYINASWITGNKEIATQGPLPNTCVHHLQMILEQKIDVVVMLSKLEEPAHEGKQRRFHLLPNRNPS